MRSLRIALLAVLLFLTALGPTAQAAQADAGLANGHDPVTNARLAILEGGHLSGIDPSVALALDGVREATGQGSVVRFQQFHGAIPVLAAQVVVRLDRDGRPLSVGGETVSNLAVELLPRLDALAATNLALATVTRDHGGGPLQLEASAPRQEIFAAPLLGLDAPVHPRLTWRLDVTSPDGDVDDLIIDAVTGDVLLQFDGLHRAKDRGICNNNSVERRSAVACGTGDLLISRGEADPPVATVAVNQAHDYLGAFHDLLETSFGRDSLDDGGLPLRASVLWCTRGGSGCPLKNAFWSSETEQVYFGAGMAVDDVVVHELVHGLTHFTSDLEYFGQSGAINESLSDVFGELFDLQHDDVYDPNDDDPDVRWLLGEALPGGAIRNLADPPAKGQPDRMGSPLWTTGSGDNGGVHTNSGVGNKLAWLITEGGSFNGHTVSPLGGTKALALYYEVSTGHLTAASDYADLGAGLLDACSVLVGTAVLTTTDCEQVARAVAAVEIDVQRPVFAAGELTATNTTETSTTLTWPAATDDTGVVGYRLAVGGVPFHTAEPAATSHVVTDLAPATDHTFTVVALDGADNESFPLQVLVTTLADTDAPVFDPGELVASNVGARVATLTWPAATDNVAVTGYEVLQDDNVVAVTAADKTSAVITGLEVGTEYAFGVRATDDAGLQSMPLETIVTTSSDGEAPVFDEGELIATDTDQTSTTLTWPPATDNVGVIGYDVLLDGDLLASVDPDTTTQPVTGLEAGQEQLLSVVARDGAQNVSEPLAVAVTTLAAPPEDVEAPVFGAGGLTASSTTLSSTTLSWPVATDNVGVLHYEVQDGQPPVVVATTQATTHQVTGMGAGTTHAFGVTAVDEAGNRSATLTLSVTTNSAPPPPPPPPPPAPAPAPAPATPIPALAPDPIDGPDGRWYPSRDLGPDGTLVTDPGENGGPDTATPLVVEVRLPEGGRAGLGLLTFSADRIDGTLDGRHHVPPDPGQLEFGNIQVDLDITPTGTQPSIVTVRMHRRLLSAGADLSTLVLLLDGEVVPTCGEPDATTGATCITAITEDAEGVVELVLRLTHNSVLSFATTPPAGDAFCDAQTMTADAFPDILPTSPHRRAAQCLAAAGVLAGTSSGEFLPERPLTRAQAASLIVGVVDVLGLTLPSATLPDFTDLPTNSPHAASIRRLAAAGIAQGRDGLFHPTAPVTRAQFAAMMVRAFLVTTGTAPQTIDRFRDDDGHVLEQSMNEATALGLVRGIAAAIGDPNAVVTRAQAASIASRFANRLTASAG